ncbi:nucleotide exchange factor SIL1 [Purpureocillium lavendulum]|uniref:Nucleotide exchange factor SIL1 n=1 Tax=Purpureocillium lavendulum TaxID=1247861 RepID=A0AB34G2V1_9HYPO|nr:nucleotide exchange factor SIL1 [Purpureocillium lavendulum]
MPRFSVAFSRRKSAADEFEHVPITTPPEQHSFRVIERKDVANGRTFDGGARMARASANVTPKPNYLDLNAEDNMFADLKTNRGSGLSNTTNATSTDNSSRHSNASTAPSSTDFTGGSGQDDHRYAAKPPPLQRPPQSQPQESPGRGSIKSSFLDRATRTFSFGGQKKHTIPPPKESSPIPDVPPILTFHSGEESGNRSRGLTASSVSTATPTQQDQAGLDFGADFGSMMPSFDKRASMATLKNDAFVEPRALTGVRPVQPAPLSPDNFQPSEPLLSAKSSVSESDASPDAYDTPPPPVPRHQTPGSFKYANRTSDVVEDEDAKLLRDSVTAMKSLAAEESRHDVADLRTYRYRRDEDAFTATPQRTIASTFNKEDNMFEGSTTRFSRPSQPYTPRSFNNKAPQNKVMTPAEFERYRLDKERQGTNDKAAVAAAKEADDEDEINYDDDEDEQEKSKQQAKQRRKQEAHMAVYRQQMMKVTGEPAPSTPIQRIGRPGLLPSSSAPQLSQMKAPSPDPIIGVSDEDDDEDVPLGILQAHGFPAKNRPPTRLSQMPSNSHLRSSSQGPPPGRPASVVTDSRRHSVLPAFARNLPQDPFVGASIARPAVRESLAFGGDAGQSPRLQVPTPPGGLVGVIASEERSRAMRRGSPSIDPHQMANMNGPNGPGFDPVGGIPQHMMYNNMPQMPPPMLTPGDQAQIQMTQQMQQFMQMQMQFMQMMAVNQNGGGPPMQQPPMPPQQMPPPGQQPMHNVFGGPLPYNQSMADLSSRHSMMAEPMPNMMEPRRMDYGMRTMSMVQPSSASFMQPPPRLGAPSIRGSMAGYTPSIAPSERSNIGLPGRYRPVSVAPPSPALDEAPRATTMSGGLSSWSDDKSKSTVKAVPKNDGHSGGEDDDDEQGWEEMRAKRDKKRSLWKNKKSFFGELAL